MGLKRKSCQRTSIYFIVGAKRKDKEEPSKVKDKPSRVKDKPVFEYFTINTIQILNNHYLLYENIKGVESALARPIDISKNTEESIKNLIGFSSGGIDCYINTHKGSISFKLWSF